MPAECFPPGKRGKLSYTINDPVSSARVEVLLKGRAFRLIKLGVSENGFLDNLGYIVAIQFSMFSKSDRSLDSLGYIMSKQFQINSTCFQYVINLSESPFQKPTCKINS